MYEEVKNMAQKKQIQVTFMLTGDCGSRENRRYKVYNQLARATNGEVFNLMKSDILDILEYVKENTKSRSDIIASKIFPPGYGNKIEYAVDSKMNDLIISVTGLTPKIEVTDSEGNKVDIKHIVNKDEIAIMKATDLKPGVYVADVGSTSETYVKVMAKTSVNFYYGFSPFETSSLSDTATRPAPDGESYLSIKLQGEGVKLESVKIFDMDGNILEELPLRLNNEKERLYVTKSFHPPNIAFQLSVFGYVEENKSSIKRTSLTPIERQSEIVGSAVNVAPSVTIIEGAKLFVDYRTPLQVKCKVHGYPKPDITWQEKDSGVTTGPSKVLVIEAPYDYMSILHIEKPNKNITYECKAQNTLDTIKSNIQIETNVYFNVLETPPDTVEIEYGKEGNIRCIIDASPPASISWQYNGSLLSNGTDIVISPDMQTVTIKHATLESQGIFICEVKNEYNTKSFSSKVSVIGLEKPQIDKPDEKINVVKGADVQLTCRILRGTPKPTMQWNYQNKAKNLKELEEINEALLLKNVTVDDEGKYTCNASNIVGSQSYTIDVIVEYLPTIKEDGIKMIETKDSVEVTLPCNVDGLPTPTVRWLRNGTILHSSKNILTTSDFSLKIRRIDVSDTGSYTCEAENHLGSTNKSIDVLVFDKPVIEKPVEKIRAVKGTDVQLTCRTLRGTPKPSIQWHFQHKTKSLKELEEINEALLLKNVSVDDEGKYTCNASNIVGSQSYTIDVIVEYPPSIKEDGIKIIETKDGDEVILPCKVGGSPTPTVRWLRNGIILHNSMNILTTPDFSLKITAIGVSDTGSYTCEAENHLGSIKKSVDINVFDKPVIEKPVEKIRAVKGTDVQLTCRITAIGVSDTGSYTCEAENHLGSIKKSVDINVFDKPVIEKPVEKIRAVKGTDVQLTCRTLRGTPKPSIQWHFQHKTKSLKELEEINEALLLKNVSVDDEGKYTCNASNIVGSQSYTIDVIVEYPPSIKEDGIKIIETKDGDEVILPCKVDGSPTPTVRWLRNGTILHNSKNILTTPDFSLRISEITVSDTGYYMCKAENHLGFSNKSIEIFVFEKPAIDKPKEKVRVVKGTEFQLTCRILRGTPKATMHWSFESRKSKKFKELVETNEVLPLKNVRIEDEGRYTCNASNLVGSQSYTMDVTVEYPPTIKEDGIKMIQTLNNDIDVTLPCNVDGVPTPTVKWVRNGTTLHTTKDIFTTSDHSLKIRTIKLSYTGIYTCEAENYLDSASKSIIVYVFDKPVIDKPYGETRAPKGSDVKLTCRIVRGTPEPTMQWYFQQRKAKKFREIKDDTEALLIKNVGLDDEGTYKCNASNIVGSQSYTMDLVVEYPPSIKDDGIKMIKALNGDAVTLACSVDGVPTPTVKWVRNGMTLHTSKDIVITSDHSLKIRTKLSDDGLYTCVAENYMDSSSKSIIVNVFEKPVIVKPYGETRAPKGTDVKLTCRIVRGTPAPTMQWYFQQRKAKKFREIKDDTEALLIKNVGLDDEGTYKCNASNIVGSQSYTMDLVVEYPPTIKDDGVKMIKALNGDAVTLPCSVDGVPTPTVKWVRNGMTLRTSKNIVTTSDHSLKFKAIKVSDSGYYTCKAENRFGPSIKTILVYVFEKPVIVRPVEKIRAVEGAYVQLICRISRGTPKPTIQWHFRARKAKKFRELKKNKETLSFKDVRVVNAGTYMCNASNIVGSQHYTMDLTVEYPPTVKDDGIKRINAKDGEDVTLPCNVDGVPTPTVKWLNGYTTLRRSKKFLTTSDNSLKITRIHVPETGYYTCQAKNHLGTSKKTVFVFVFVPPSIEKPKASTINLMVGRDLILSCHADGYPEPQIKWLFKEFDTRATPRNLRSNDKTKGFSLPRVQLRDQGNYTCEASNIGGTTNITYIVNVYAPPIIQNPYAVKIFTCVKGDLGLRIQCKAEGYPKPSIVWKKDNLNIVSDSKWYDIEEGALIIKNIEKRQQGTYTCLATNIMGYDSSVYTVIVNDYPIVPKIESPMLIRPGSSLDVPCNIKHKSTDSMRWYKDSRLIAYGKLTLKHISYLDSGIYSCRVGDMWESSSAHVEIKIGFKPSFYKKETETIQFEKGKFYPLSCLARGQPEPKVTWKHNGKTLSVSSMIYTIEMTLSNRGNFTCEISNSLGTIKRSFRIISQDCILEIKKDFLRKNQPMMLTPHMEWPLFPIEDGFMLIETGEPFYLYCPANFVILRMNFIRVFCAGETQIKINGKIYEFSEIECTEEIKPDLIKRTNPCLFGNGVNVEVGYKIFNQYNVSTNKNVWWPTYFSPYNFDTIYNCETQTYVISSILKRPFHYNDKCCFGKRQLVSPMDFLPGIPASTAYTYLNVVPHWSTCNSKNWAELEQKVRSLAKLLNTNLTVLTGTVEPLQMKKGRVYRKIAIYDDQGKKLSVAQYLWKVVQDPESASSLAIIQVNAPDLSPKDIPIFTRCKDICEEIEWMKGTNWRNVADGYTYCCSILEFETTFNYRGEFSRGKTGVLNMRSDTPAYPDYSDYY
ncbi:unnamed protein product [Arctia plantaginis]|uniref:Hemolin n=1 Tax=Arctia plantaginis TaxID=874455 RepID=A0A8S1B1T2_ARCPL|nr:unnamed protein product [Arctia plantaginis]